MQVRLLGDLAVVGHDGRAIEVRGTKLRTLLALLALDAGNVVAADRLADVLWGEHPPPSVRNSLQALVSKLRRLLGDPDLVAIRGGGYVLQLPPDSIDVEQYERLVQDATQSAGAGHHASALDALREAAALRRGQPLAEFTYDDFAQGPIARLTELHIRATELQIDAELALGRHHDVLPDLEAAVTTYPLREHLRAQLMVALYRSGRQADALRAFQEARDVLAEELGLDPGPELRQLEAAILRQDEALDLDVPAAPPASAPPQHQWRWDVPARVDDVVGRDAEIAELTEAMVGPRLVTLVGPGGVGKTRLALEVARHVARDFDNGAVVVELAAVSDGPAVRHALAAALRIPHADGLTHLLADAELLVVLDNCEHVLPSAATLAEELLTSCPRLRVLATSREPLHIGGEHVRDLDPLAVDAAVALFVQRAAAAGGPPVDEQQRDIVTDICQRLDGLPLAIELAAARTRTFPLHQLADRLDDRFRLLRTGSRTALPRQQTLGAVVEWSYDTLFSDQRRLLERLSVFPGGFTIDSARAVCADAVVDGDDLEDLVGALVDKSLVNTHWVGGGVRFSQLQTLRQYGQDRLAERDDAADIQRRMRAHFASLCGLGTDAFRGVDQAAWLATVTAEHDNLRAALDAAIEAGDAETALAIGGGVGWHQWLNGLLAEGREWIDTAFTCVGTASPRTRAVALMNRGYFEFVRASFRVDDSGGASQPPPDVDPPFVEAVALLRAEGDDATLGLVLGFWAELTLARGDVEGARALRMQEKGVYDGRGDGWSQAAATYARAVLDVLGDAEPAVAEGHYRLAAERYEACGSAAMQAVCLIALADFAEARGDVTDAVALLDAAVAINRRLQVVGVTGVALSRLGNALVAADDVDRAAGVIEEALELGQRVASTPVIAAALSSRARLALRRGLLDDAERSALAALELIRPTRRPDSGRARPGWAVPAGSPILLGVLGSVALGRGNHERAIAFHREAVAAAIRTGDSRVMATAASGLVEAMLASGGAAVASRLADWVNASSATGAPTALAAEQLADLAGIIGSA